MDERTRVRVIVTGQVQGVGFRYSCQRAAEKHGVAGSVANRADGSVEAYFEGSPEDVRALVEWCRTGPSGAHVSDVTVTDEKPTGDRGFSTG